MNPDSNLERKREHNETQKRIAADRALKRQEWNRKNKPKKEDK